MTVRLKGVVVTFEADIREDDAQRIIDAISMVRGVLSVDKAIRDYNDIMNRRRVEAHIKERIWDAFANDSEVT